MSNYWKDRWRIRTSVQQIKFKTEAKMFKKQNKQKTSRSSLLFFQFHFLLQSLSILPPSPRL